jgi:hypothetical protein
MRLTNLARQPNALEAIALPPAVWRSWLRRLIGTTTLVVEASRVRPQPRDFPVTSVLGYALRLERSERMRAIVVLLVLVVLSGEAVAEGETCTSYLTGQREKMIVAALACEGTLGQKQSVRSQAEAEREGQKLLTYAECSKPVAVQRAGDLFPECVRTHLCAAQTYTCALSRTTAKSSVPECGAAMTACKITDPIPQ